MLRFEYENILNAVRIKCVRFRYKNHRNRLVLAIRNNDSVLRNEIKIMRYVRHVRRRKLLRESAITRS